MKFAPMYNLKDSMHIHLKTSHFTWTLNVNVCALDDEQTANFFLKVFYINLNP